MPRGDYDRSERRARTRARLLEADVPPECLEQVAIVMLALGAGMGLVKLADPESVRPQLLGAVFVLLLRALETSGEARQLLSEPSTPSSSRLRSSPPV